MTVAEFVKSGNMVHFEYLRSGVMYYSVKNTTNECVFIFPVPISDVGQASMLATDKAITYMRWIRKAIDSKEMVYATPK
jgi:hypothetical protein